MKKNILSVFSIAFLLMFISCDFDVADMKLSKDNSKRQKDFYKTEKAWEQINFLEHAQPLVFGVSTEAVNNSVVVGGNPSAYGGRNMGEIPVDTIEIKSIGDGKGGKIAGSEDGLTFYFKEVSVNKNFKITADIRVVNFASGSAPNGQEAWGIMARDFIPQYGRGTTSDTTMDAFKANTAINGLFTGSLSNYYRPGSTGGDSNMIMVGGIKRGIRAYWRRGVAWNGTTTLSNGWTLGNGNPMAAGTMNHDNTNFYFWPREWGNFIDMGDSAYQEHPDFPRYYDPGDDIPSHTYTITLERNNNGFFWTIEHPNEGVYPNEHIMKGEPKKGRIRDRTVPDRFNSAYEYDPNSKDPRPKIEPVDKGSIPPYEDILKSVNTQNYYVGFFASRDAVIWVNNISYFEADKDDCDPQDPIIPSRIDAVMEILTPEIYTGVNYLHIKTNVPGYIVVDQDRKRIPNSVIQNNWVNSDTGSAISHNVFIIPILPLKDGDNTFKLSFYPNANLPEEIAASTYEGVILSSTEAINRTFVIKKKVYHGGTGDIFVGKDGHPRNSGTESSPLDLQTAIAHVQPGQDIVMLDGVYLLQEGIVIPRYNNGTSGQRKTLRAKNKDKVALDWSWKKNPVNNAPPFEPMKNRAIHLMGDYWTLEGFHIRNAPEDVKGIEVGGSNNILRWLSVYTNGDTGVQIAGASNEPTSYWPSNNKIEYCDSFNNRDTADTNADGFAAKLTVGKDNIFYRCVGFYNVDDGWDFFAKRETGPIGIVTILECVSYKAGTMMIKQPNGTWQEQLFGSSQNKASKNGFKMGGEGISVKHIAIESISFANDGYAFTSNSNPSIIVRNSTSIASSGGGIENIRIYGNTGASIDGYELNCVSTKNGGNVNIPPDVFTGILYDVEVTEIWARSLDGYDGYRGKFLKRKADGRPELGTVYKSGDAGKGAWALYN